MEETENQQLQVFVCFGSWFGNIVDLSCLCMKNSTPDDTPMFDLEDCLNKNENGNLNIQLETSFLEFPLCKMYESKMQAQISLKMSLCKAKAIFNVELIM